MFTRIQHLRVFRGNLLNFKRNYPYLSFQTSPWLHFSRWSKSLLGNQNSFEARLPWITIDALAFLNGNVQAGSKVFEYGMGGSTLYWLDKGCEVFGVEHDKPWFEKLMKDLGVNKHLEARFFEGEVAVGKEADNEIFKSSFLEWNGLNFKKYVLVANELPDNSLDIAMVDGRARVACVSAIRQKVKPGGILILDNSERLQYKQALDLLKAEDWVGRHFPGPGLFHKYGFWCTSVFRKPANE